MCPCSGRPCSDGRVLSSAFAQVNFAQTAMRCFQENSDALRISPPQHRIRPSGGYLVGDVLTAIA
jgi:hypothetical protein